MNYKKEIYESLINQINANCLTCKTSSVWNNQIENLEEEDDFDYPAVFFELIQNGIDQLGNNYQQWTGEVIVHIIDEKYDITQYDIFDISNSVFTAMQKFKPRPYTAYLVRTDEQEDTNYDNLYHLIQKYSFSFCIDNNIVQIETNVTNFVNNGSIN